MASATYVFALVLSTALQNTLSCVFPLVTCSSTASHPTMLNLMCQDAASCVAAFLECHDEMCNNEVGFDATDSGASALAVFASQSHKYLMAASAGGWTP